METSLQVPSSPQALDSLLQFLETDYYARLDRLCNSALLHIAELQKEAPEQGESLYVSLCQKMLGQIDHYVRLRRFGLVPYVRELLDKENTGHDCRICSKPCAGRHMTQIAMLRESHTKLREILYRLQSVANPIYHPGVTPIAVYHTLRAEMMQVDTALTEMFYLEESSLLPKVFQAQEAIHVRS